MAGWRQAVEVAMTDEDVARLMAISRSRTEPASRVERAQMLLAYREKPSFFAVGQRLGVHHQTVQRCIARAGPWRPGFPVEGDHRFRWMTTTCSGRWRPGQQGCGRA